MMCDLWIRIRARVRVRIMIVTRIMVRVKVRVVVHCRESTGCRCVNFGLGLGLGLELRLGLDASCGGPTCIGGRTTPWLAPRLGCVCRGNAPRGPTPRNHSAWMHAQIDIRRRGT